MKKRILLGISIVFLLVAVIITVVPAFGADLPHGASIDKNSVVNSDGSITSTITITDNDQNAKDTLTLTLITDTVYHKASTEFSGDLKDQPTVHVLTHFGDSCYATYTYWPVDGDPNPLEDYAYVTGLDSGIISHPLFILSFPGQVSWPVPELSAGILFGLGALGLGGFVLVNRKKSKVSI